MWNVEKQQEMYAVTASRQVAAVVFSPDGRRLASACRDGTLRLLNAETGQVTRTLTGHDGGVTSVAWSGDGKFLASGSYDMSVKVWDASTGEVFARSAWARAPGARCRIQCRRAMGGFGELG